ncbi:MAG: SWIM zinc finger family protein [bacterium]|nr:SWIM zinc finger family protein [bacterium]
MRKVTQQQIMALAVNATALNNARKICSGNKFISHLRSEDDTFYMGECKGSGKSNYTVSVDFIEESAPVFRCTCPSRQLPCKHGLALLLEMEAGKEFQICEIPQDILDKRAKKEAREAKKAEAAADPQKKKKVNKAARSKKMKKQLEGLAMLEKMIAELLDNGLGTMGGVSLKSYRELAKQLGDYYLPEPLNLMNRLILEMEKYQEDWDNAHYENAVQILVRLRALTKKATVYLSEKLETGNMEDDDSILYEELGGIWTLERLQELGLTKADARLVQLAFSTRYDEATKEYVDVGYFMDADKGEIHVTYNYRPVKVRQRIKEEDSIFDMIKIPLLHYYPGGINQRVRWDKWTLEPLNDELRAHLMQMAQSDLALMAKQVKNQIKNTLSEDSVAVAIQFRRIGKLVLPSTESTPASLKQPKEQAAEASMKQTIAYQLEDAAGNRITLRDKKGEKETVSLLAALSARSLFENQVLFGMVYYDAFDHQLCMQPYSILTKKAIVRLWN